MDQYKSILGRNKAHLLRKPLGLKSGQIRLIKRPNWCPKLGLSGGTTRPRQ